MFYKKLNLLYFIIVYYMLPYDNIIIISEVNHNFINSYWMNNINNNSIIKKKPLHRIKPFIKINKVKYNKE